MPTYEYECEKCKRTFEVEQKISDERLVSCPCPDPRTLEERRQDLDLLGPMRDGQKHPDRCRCQGAETTPHKHYSDPPFGCARCGECEAYRPAIEVVCGGPVRRLISGSSFVLKGGGWAKDGY